MKNVTRAMHNFLITKGATPWAHDAIVQLRIFWSNSFASSSVRLALEGSQSVCQRLIGKRSEMARVPVFVEFDNDCQGRIEFDVVIWVSNQTLGKLPALRGLL